VPHRPSPTPARPRRRVAAGALALTAVLAAGALPAAAAVDPPSPVVLTVTEGVDRTAGSAEVCLDDWWGAEVYRFYEAANSWVAAPIDVPYLGSGCHVLSWDLGTTIPDHAGRYRVATSPMDLPGTADAPGHFDVVVRLAPAVVAEHPADAVVTGGEVGWFTAAAAPPATPGSPRARPQWQFATSDDAWAWIPGVGGADGVWGLGTREVDGTVLVRAVFSREPLSAFQIAPEPVATDPATLTVWASVALEHAPRDAEVAADDEVTFDVGQVWGVAPALQWEHRAPGGEWEAVPGAVGSELTMVAGDGDAVDGARFRLCHENAFSARACSAEAALTVTYTAPEVTLHPEPVTALPGEPVDFMAAAAGSESVRWESRAPGGDWAPTVPTGRATGDELDFSWTVWASVDLDGTEYRAVFRGAGDLETASDPALLTVLVLPPVDVSVSAVVRLVGHLPGW